MGIYLRKSVSVGPLRFNLSKSGIGVSAGIRGLRVGAGPRGNYIHMGRGGVYYKKTLPPTKKKASEVTNAFIPAPTQTLVTHAPLEEIESVAVSALVDSDSAELLEELNSKRKEVQIWPAILVIGIIVTAFASWSSIGFVVTIALTIGAYYLDQLRKSSVLFYDLEEEEEKSFARLHKVISEMAASKNTWHIEAQGKVYDKKYHAGADSIIERKPTLVGVQDPPYVKTNIVVPTIGVGKQTLYFFPDRILVFTDKGVGSVAYSQLVVKAYVANFIESDPVPSDAKIVGRTWRYVNKKGGPDKRFSMNPEIPIVEYGYIDLTSASGLNERICLSRTDVLSNLSSATKALARA